MRWWLKWFVIGILTAWIGYHRYWTSQLTRTHTAGSSHISSSLANNTGSFHFFNSLQQIKQSYFEMEETVYAHGLCGNVQVPPTQRPCTPPLHVHPKQTEYFTLLQGQLAYQLDDKVYSCDIHTCPRPLVIPPLLPHTFWMNDNKEDLIVSIRIEPANNYNGMRREIFETFAGIFRDEHASIWQIFVLFENAETYLAFVPLPLMKIIFKVGAFIGQLLGYKVQYEAYTTGVDDSN